MLYVGRLKVKSVYGIHCYLVRAESGLWHIATIRMREDHECSVELEILFDNRFLTTLCGSRHDSDTGCGTYAQVDDLADRYRRHFSSSNITISRQYC